MTIVARASQWLAWHRDLWPVRSRDQGGCSANVRRRQRPDVRCQWSDNGNDLRVPDIRDLTSELW